MNRFTDDQLFAIFVVVFGLAVLAVVMSWDLP